MRSLPNVPKGLPPSAEAKRTSAFGGSPIQIQHGRGPEHGLRRAPYRNIIVPFLSEDRRAGKMPRFRSGSGGSPDDNRDCRPAAPFHPQRSRHAETCRGPECGSHGYLAQDRCKYSCLCQNAHQPELSEADNPCRSGKRSETAYLSAVAICRSAILPFYGLISS